MTSATSASASVSKERALFLSALTTFISLFPTAYAALISNSIILFADLLRCVTEFLAILISWIIVKRVVRGDRSRYNYGFGKLEQFSGMWVGMAMLITFAVMVFTAAHRLMYPQPVEGGLFGLILSVLAVAGNGVMWFHGRRLAKQQASPLLEAQWRLFRAKAGASTVVLLSLLCSLMSRDTPLGLYADAVGSLLLSSFLLYSAIGLLSSSMRDLVDCSVDEAAQLPVLQMLVQHDGDYEGLNEIRSRRSGAQIIVDIFLEFKSELSLVQIHERTERMKSDLAKRLNDVKVTIIPLPLSRRRDAEK